jgi:hypothetical protein
MPGLAQGCVRSNGIPLGVCRLLPVDAVNYVATLKAVAVGCPLMCVVGRRRMIGPPRSVWYSSFSSSQHPLATNPCMIGSVRYLFFHKELLSKMSLRCPPLFRLKRCHACDPMACLSGVHSLTGWHCKFRPNTEGGIVAATRLPVRHLTMNSVATDDVTLKVGSLRRRGYPYDI